MKFSVSHMKIEMHISECEIYNSLLVTYTHLGTIFPTWNVEFSVHLTWKYRYNIFCIKCSIFHVRVMKIGMQILWQEIRKCLFHISKYGHRFSHMKYGIFSYFSFENFRAVFPSRNIKYCLFNIWKKCIHSPTRNVEFSQRFSCLSSEILYISIKKAWMKVFWYETWNSVYFT